MRGSAARLTRVSPLAFALFAGTAGVLVAGPLTPPSGSPGSTYKTLSEVEPRIAINAANTPGDADSVFRITEPGSYYLTSDLIGEVGKHGIEVAVSNVTIDLNGFRVQGVPSMGSFDGITTGVANLRNITIVNGTVTGWGDSGIDLGQLVARGGRVERVNASFNVTAGIFAGEFVVVSHCNALDNFGAGISALAGCTIVSSSACRNGLDGITAGSGCSVINSVARSNTGAGITVGTGSSVVDSVSSNNNGSGIFAALGSMIRGCVAYQNRGNGIVVTSDCLVQGNNSRNNGNMGDGAGILVSGSDNRIEGNNCTDNTRGIDVDASGNIIVRNTCSGNGTNWDIVAGNSVAPIVSAATNAAAIVGNTFAGSLGSTDPNANFTY